MKKIMLIIGNGFTIDFVSRLNNKNIDTRDLFRFGSHVVWPENEDAGFLSFKNTPNLWSLGIRPGIIPEKSQELLEDIITCNNVYSILKEKPKESQGMRNLYRNAYKELSVYLHFLFSYYNDQVDDGEISEAIDKWHYFEFIKKISQNEKYKICIVTYNYDIWLERMLKISGIDYHISGIGDETSGIKIVKPHGSISFVKDYIDRERFQSINLDTEPQDCQARDLKISHERLSEPRLFYPLIPPAGEASRMRQSWATTLRTEASQFASTLSENDEIVVIGISYWNVDREEIDELLTSVNSSVTARYINPYPNRTLMAVMTAIFHKFVYYDAPSATGGIKL